MLAPKIEVLPPGAFAKWMKLHGSLGAKHKVPRYSRCHPARKLAGGTDVIPAMASAPSNSFSGESSKIDV